MASKLADAGDSDSVEIQWSVYAEYYDDMCSMNPAYGSMIDLVVAELQKLDFGNGFRALDVGAGTGNLLSKAAPLHPDASFQHLDLNAGMNRLAQAKYEALNINNIELVEADFLEWHAPDASYDVVMSTNALYAMQPPKRALEKIYALLRPRGALLLVDFGRKQNTNDWMIYVAMSSLKQNGLRKTVQLFRKNWEAARQNRRTTAAQLEGQYWLHETSDLAVALQDAGFVVSSIGQCYRGYSDIAVCIKSE